MGSTSRSSSWPGPPPEISNPPAPRRIPPAAAPGKPPEKVPLPSLPAGPSPGRQQQPDCRSSSCPPLPASLFRSPQPHPPSPVPDGQKISFFEYPGTNATAHRLTQCSLECAPGRRPQDIPISVSSSCPAAAWPHAQNPGHSPGGRRSRPDCQRGFPHPAAGADSLLSPGPPADSVSSPPFTGHCRMPSFIRNCTAAGVEFRICRELKT